MTHGDETLALLLRGVLDEPGDDGARLRYADRCEELGDAERAEFIRVQVELAKHETHVVLRPGHIYHYFPPPGGGATVFIRNDTGADMYLGYDHKDITPLVRRERELLEERGLLWCAFCPPRDGIYKVLARPILSAPDTVESSHPGAHQRFSRGFVEHVTLTAADAVAHLDAVLAAQPVREVTLTTMRVDAAAFWRRKWLRAKPDIALLTLDLLRAEWPRVETWHLPEPEGGYVVPDELAPLLTGNVALQVTNVPGLPTVLVPDPDSIQLVGGYDPVMGGDPDAPKPMGVINALVARGKKK